jgi:hypothetical protein
MEETVTVNGTVMTLEEFEEFKKKLDKSTILVENGPMNYTTRMFD